METTVTDITMIQSDLLASKIIEEFCSKDETTKNPGLSQMEVTRVNDQGDRILFYGGREDDHVIGSNKTAADVKVGDTIVYEPDGWNFGWFQKRLS
jgi:hypothetical protein